MSRNGWREDVRLPAALRLLLEASGLPWSVRNGAKHYGVYVGDTLVQVLSRGHRNSTRHEANMMSNVKRRLRELGGTVEERKRCRPPE